MKQAVRRIGRSLAAVLPVLLVLSGTLAVTRVPWAVAPAGEQVLAASAKRAGGPAARAERLSPQDALREDLVTEVWREDPTVALTSLQQAVDRRPSLARHCPDIALALGEVAVQKYGSARRAQQYARPVCDTSYAAGVAQAG